MNCNVCGRNLKDDSKYCDFCGTKLDIEPQVEVQQTSLNTKLLFKWLFISLVATSVISVIAIKAGFPILFGGLFLPFFFRKKFQK